MTKKELSQLYNLNREIEQDKRRIAELEAAAMGVSAKITGLPHVAGISDKTALAAEIADLKNIVESKAKMTVAEHNRIMRFVASVEDSMMRQVITLRHVDGLSWRAVAAKTGVTEGSIKMAYARFFEKESQK